MCIIQRAIVLLSIKMAIHRGRKNRVAFFAVVVVAPFEAWKWGAKYLHGNFDATKVGRCKWVKKKNTLKHVCAPANGAPTKVASKQGVNAFIPLLCALFSQMLFWMFFSGRLLLLLFIFSLLWMGRIYSHRQQNPNIKGKSNERLNSHGGNSSSSNSNSYDVFIFATLKDDSLGSTSFKLNYMCLKHKQCVRNAIPFTSFIARIMPNQNYIILNNYICGNLCSHPSLSLSFARH